MDLSRLRPLHASPEITAVLTDRIWEWGPLHGPAAAWHVRLLAGGDLAGRVEQRRWGWEPAGLAFFNGLDLRSTVFDQVSIDDDGRWTLFAPQQTPDGRPHILREAGVLGRPAPAAEGVDPVRRRAGPLRRNLVVLRAGRESLHNAWPRDVQDLNRSWDLCVSFFDREEGDLDDEWSEHRVVQANQRKFGALHALMHEASPLWAYDYIAFPDDDVMLGWGDWNRLFAICREHRLELAQPAMSHLGYIAHSITGRDERYRLRYVSFVEVMTPIFSRPALATCVSTFKDSVSGFGLDNTWPKLLGEPEDRIAIIDEVEVVHTRPQGSSYSIEEAIAEGNAVQYAYDAPSRLLEYGGLFADPISRQGTG